NGEGRMLPLIARYPALSALPRASFAAFPTPIVLPAALGLPLWIKRDDLSADPMGGNKARALEFLLGSVRAGDSLVTVGSAGSTHALAVATYGRRLGATVYVGRWKQEMNDAADVVSLRLAQDADAAPVFRSPVGAYAWAFVHRVHGAKWIPAG